MEILDQELLRKFNDLIARVGALERLAAADVGARWTREDIAAWERGILAASDRTAPRSEVGAAHGDEAVGRLAKRLMAAARS